jgi:hypothetical protein
MKIDELINKGFLALLSVVAIWIGREVDKMSDSVSELNIKIATIIANQNAQEKLLDRHEGRIRILESEKLAR